MSVGPAWHPTCNDRSMAGEAARWLTEALGWLSSSVLLATVVAQVRKQSESASRGGVSGWLYVGQMAASFGFTIYSWLVHNWIFVVTNALLLLVALRGWVVQRRQSAQLSRQDASRFSSDEAQ